MKRFFLLIMPLLLCSILSFAQNEQVEMADGLRSSGKIYVVVAVILTIFAGLVIYLVRLDRRLSKLEKTNHS